MVGADRIVHSIIEEAEQKADQVLKNAHEQKEDILEEAKKQAEQKKSSILHKGEQQAVEIKKRVLSVGELDMKKDILAAKQHMIDRAFNEVLDKLHKMDKDQYLKILYDMFMKSVEKGDEEVIISNHDDRITQEFLDGVNRGLLESGRKGELRLSNDTINIKGGFVLKSGGIEINNSFESIIRMERDHIEPQVAEILFGKE